MAKIIGDMLGQVDASMRSSDAPALHGETARSSQERQYEGRSRLNTACVLRVDRIAADPNQPRTEFEPDALARLAESMKTRGQLQPIRVRWDEPLGLYVVVVGERRWRAARVAGLETVACVVETGSPTPEDLLEDQLVENALREDLKPIEQARAYRTLCKSRGLTVRALGERLHVSAASVSRALALLELPADVQDDVEAGRIAPATAYQISKVADPAEQATLARAAAAGTLTRDGAARTRKPKPRRVEHRDPNGCVVTVTVPEGLGDGAAVEALQRALKGLRSGERAA